MTIYCDESGGLNAGAVTFAAVMLTPETASQIHDRFRSVTGLRGELKGSRISLIERAYLMEIFDRAGGRAWVAVARKAAFSDQRPLDGNGQPIGKSQTDLAVYTALLNLAVGSWLPETGGVCTDVVIDEGRYDPVILAGVQAEIQSGLGQWGRASMTDSRRSGGVQLADVIANSLYNIAAGSERSPRIQRILDPMLASKAIRIAELKSLPQSHRTRA
jgi:hypothetical protein